MLNRTRSSTAVALAGGLALLASACSSSHSGGGIGGAPAGVGGSNGSGGGSQGTGGAAGVGGSNGAGGAGTGGAVGTGGSNGADGGQDVSTVVDANHDAPVIHDGSVGDAGAYVHSGWTATYTCTGACPAPMTVDQGDVTGNAFDGTTTTRWSTGQFQSTLNQMNRFPLYFTVDMGQVMNVSKITMHPGCKDSFDSTATVEIFLATDGTSIATAVFAAAAGPVHQVPTITAGCANINSAPTAANGLDTITFAQAPARFIRIKGTQRTSSDRYWAIGELNVFP